MLTCGIDIGGSKISMGMVRGDSVIRKVTFPNIFFGNPGGMVAAIAEAYEQLAEGEPPMRLGAGSPGWVIDGTVRDAVNLGITSFPLRDALKSACGAEVFVENDARCALLAELGYGALKDCGNGAMVTFGTGVGGALVIGKKLYRGSFGYAGEVGHLTTSSNGDCACGKNGCFELTGAVPSLLRLCAEQGLSVAGAKEAFEAAAAEDARAKDALCAYLPLAARGVAELAMLLDLDTICIGGGISAQRALFVDPLAELVHRQDARCRIVPAVFSNDAGIIGAAQLPA